MSAADMRIMGQEELRDALRQIEESVRGRVAREALVAAAEPIAAQARQDAPRGVKNSARLIDVGVWEDRMDVTEVAVGPAASGGRASRREGFYLLFSEVGTVERKTKKGKERGRMQRKPFLRPALDAHRNRAMRTLSDRIAREIGAQ